MKFSICIPNFNYGRYLGTTIQSVLNQTYPAYEIVVVDNASTECDPEAIKVMFPLITLVKSATNIGFSKGSNLGISKAEGEYILLLNSDTILKNDAVSLVMEFLESNPDVAAATARLEFPDGRVQHNCQRFPAIRYQLA